MMISDLVRVRSFLEVAERGTIAAAALALGYTAPAVSQHISKLERELDTTLFDRVGGQLRLTSGGQALMPIVRDLLALAAQTAALTHEPVAHPPVVVSGLASALAEYIVPRLNAGGAVAGVHVREAEDASALRELRLGHVDIAIVQEYSGDDTPRDERLRYHAIARDELRLVLPPSMSPTTTVSELGDVPWLINGSGTRCAAAAISIRSAAGIDTPIVGDIADNQTLLRLVATGMGVTVVPALVLAATPVGVTVASQQLGVVRTLIAVTREPPLPEVAAVVAEIVAAVALVTPHQRGPRTAKHAG